MSLFGTLATTLIPWWITSLSVTEIDAEVKKWGNSLGIRVPAALAHEQGIEPGDTVRVRIEKLTVPHHSFFGGGKRYLAGVDIRASLAESRRQDARAEARKMRDFERARSKGAPARRARQG